MINLPDPEVGEDSTGVCLYIIEDFTDNENTSKFNFYPSTRMKGTVVCRADQSADTLISKLQNVKSRRDLMHLG
jgi:hypothetical protein